MTSPLVTRSVATDTLRLGLLRGFELRQNGELVKLPLSAQRVVAFLALYDRPLQRVYVAGSLWLDSTEERANASLRTALWRLGRPSCRLVEASTTHVGLAHDVEVDVREAKAVAELLIRSGGNMPADALFDAGELLPDWYEDWVLLERERFRQLRLHALEALCVELTANGRFAEAAEAGLAAVEGEPPGADRDVSRRREPRRGDPAVPPLLSFPPRAPWHGAVAAHGRPGRPATGPAPVV